jgi:Fe-S cluster assembly protein SufD
MSQVAERHETFVAAFETLRRDPVFGPESLRRSREHAFETFLDRGFPSTREEDWRFTSVAPIAELTFERPGSEVPDRSAIEPFLLPGVGCQIVVINGRLSRALSTLDQLPAGLTIEILAETLATAKELRAGARATGSGETVFARLNGAFFEDSVTIRVQPRTIVSEPVHVLFVNVPGTKPTLVAPRLSVVAGEASQLSVVESHAGTGHVPLLSAAVTTIDLDQAAVVDHLKIQRETSHAFHMAFTDVRLNRSSTLTSRAISFGGRIARNDIVALLNGEGAECTLHGLYVYDGDRLFDTHTTIDHAKPHCPSHEIYKGILDGRSKAVFNGKIIVRPDAQKTDAKQTNKALLLTDDAQINTKPQLEIFADDVKCTHGAAIGQLDDDAMFYLRARGISEPDARSLLIHAFAGEIVNGITADSIRERVWETMEEKLRRE